MCEARDARGGERAATTIWFLAVVVAVALVIGATVRWGAAATVDARVQSVADAAALAGVTGGEEAAREVVRRNGARLVHLAEGPDGVEVVVELAGLRATARAEGAEPTEGARAVASREGGSA